MERRPVTQALIDALTTLNWPVGDHKAPTGADRYLVVWSVPGGGFDGPPLTNPHGDVACVYQIDSVGRRQDQVEAMADRVRALLLGRNSDGTYQTSIPLLSERDPEGGPPGPTSEGAPPHQVWTNSERFVLTVLT